MADQMAMDTPPPKPVAMTTAQLLEALRAHYIKPIPASARFQGQTDSDLLVEEVCAPGSSRRCDLLRIGMWASRGHRIIVHELKVSRADFLKELEDPGKAEAWWPFCHEFWLVAPDHLIDPAEVPDGWGLMVPPADSRRRKFKVVKPAVSKEPTVTPLLMVEVARRVDNARLSEIAQLNAEHRNRLYEAVQAEKRRHVAAQPPTPTPERSTMSDKPASDEQIAQVIAAIANGDAVVCLTRCWACQFGDHFKPPRPHTWMDEEDAQHAGHPWPLPADAAAANLCGCRCAIAEAAR